MKKLSILLLCVVMILPLFSCGEGDVNTNIDNDTNINPPQSSDADTEHTTEPVTEAGADQIPAPVIDTEQNRRARQAYVEVIRNERKMYYCWDDTIDPTEIYFDRMFTNQKSFQRHILIDMNGDGIEEMILFTGTVLIVLHFEDDKVYGFDTDHTAMQMIFADGSFYWYSYSAVFGNEVGISRLSFVNGKPKYQELCRRENNFKFYLDGISVTKEQFDEYVDNKLNMRIEATPLEMSLLDSNEAKALAMAEAHWSVKNGGYDPETGYRYRLFCDGKEGDSYKIILYCFVKSYYYKTLEIASVNPRTGEIVTHPYSEGK